MINWKWPQTKNNGYLPWYLIIKNLFALPFYLIGVIFVFIGHVIVHGPKRAFCEFPDLRLL